MSAVLAVELLATIGEAAIHCELARKERAAARTALSRQRRTWMEDAGEYYERETCRGVEGADEMESALKRRADAQVEYRRASSRLRAAIAKAAPAPTPKEPTP